MRKIKIKKPGTHLIELKKPGEEVEISGVFEAKNKEKIELEVIIHHQAPRTRANTILKGVVRDQSQLRFKGQIIIDQNCEQSSSFLTERILLLSNQAHAEAVPNLEILTDDVQCSHAASISQINEKHLFYLMSRGMSKKAAEKLIVDGFLEIA